MTSQNLAPIWLPHCPVDEGGGKEGRRGGRRREEGGEEGVSRIVCEDAEAEGTRGGAEGVREDVVGVMRGCGGVLGGRVAGDAGQGRVK